MRRSAVPVGIFGSPGDIEGRISERAPTREVVPSTARSRVVLVAVVLVLAALFGPDSWPGSGLSQTSASRGTRGCGCRHSSVTSAASALKELPHELHAGADASRVPRGDDPASKLFNPTAVGKVLSIVLLIPLLANRSGGRLRSGRRGMLTVTLALSSSMFIERMAGGSPVHWPIPFWRCRHCADHRPDPLVVRVDRGGCVFYPVSAVAPGIAMFLVMFVYGAAIGRGRGLERAEASGLPGR